MQANGAVRSPQSSILGLILAGAAGAAAAVALGYAYFFAAIRLNFDLIFVMALLMGAGVGWVTGTAARIGRFRSAVVLGLLGFVFGVSAYVVRYTFEFNELVEIIVREETPPGGSEEATRAGLLADFAHSHPPGGVIGYILSIPQEGFLLQDPVLDPSINPGTPTRGFMAWFLLAFEGIGAGLFSGGLATSYARGR